MAQEDAWRSWYPKCLGDLTGWWPRFPWLMSTIDQQLVVSSETCSEQIEQEGMSMAGSPTPHGTENTIKQPNTALSITQCFHMLGHSWPSQPPCEVGRDTATWQMRKAKRQGWRSVCPSGICVDRWACAVPVRKYFEYHPGWTTGPWITAPTVTGLVLQAQMVSSRVQDLCSKRAVPGTEGGTDNQGPILATVQKLPAITVPKKGLEGGTNETRMQCGGRGRPDLNRRNDLTFMERRQVRWVLKEGGKPWQTKMEVKTFWVRGEMVSTLGDERVKSIFRKGLWSQLGWIRKHL